MTKDDVLRTMRQTAKREKCKPDLLGNFCPAKRACVCLNEAIMLAARKDDRDGR